MQMFFERISEAQFESLKDINDSWKKYNTLYTFILKIFYKQSDNKII
jgi:hypothetical protein